MSIHLTRDLESLHQHIMSMCAVVEEVVHKAVDELGRPDVALSQQLVDRDDEIDRWDVRIEEECLKILALHQPVADNLRRVTAVLKIAWELERVADVAVNIAERAAGLASGPQIPIPEKLNHMAHVALDMLRLSLDAFVNQDSRLARDVCRQDDIVDALNREIIDELLETMKRSPDLIEPALQLFSASRHVERVADHATNIAEDVVYLVEGEIIRHRAEFWKR
jgi:phosphate transport system protein